MEYDAADGQPRAKEAPVGLPPEPVVEPANALSYRVAAVRYLPLIGEHSVPASSEHTVWKLKQLLVVLAAERNDPALAEPP